MSRALVVPQPGRDLLPEGWWETTVIPWAAEQTDGKEVQKAIAAVSALEAAWRTMGQDTTELLKGTRILEIRWGELLPPEKGGRGKLSLASDSFGGRENRTTRTRFRQLAEHKRLLMDALHKMDGEKPTRAALLRTIKGDRKTTERARRQREEQAAASTVDKIPWTVKCADFRQFLPACKADVIITDPPYPQKFLPIFTDFAKEAKRFPLVAVMVGQSYLPEVMRRLCEHLTYRWTLAYLTPGGQAVQIFPRKVNTFWKPVLLFGESPDWLGDVCKSDTNDNDKTLHDWGQSVSGMQDLVKRLTKPGQTVCDPFVGGGTTAIASLLCGRSFVGCDVDAAAVATTKKRIAECRK